ncbi:hypothetical protein ACWIVU_00590 [Ursidibacter arcticus]
MKKLTAVIVKPTTLRAVLTKSKSITATLKKAERVEPANQMPDLLSLYQLAKI